MEKVDQWFAKNAHAIDLQMRVFENKFLNELQISDVDTRFLIDNHAYWGRGTSRDIELAIRKSCCEAVERYFLFTSKIATSNGFAVHTAPERAAESAKNEIIERDLFFCHFLTQTPFVRINIQEDWIKTIHERLGKLGVDLQFHSMGSINSVEGILCSISGKNAKEPFGYVLGTSAGPRNVAVESAFLEAIRNYAHLNTRHALNIKQFLLKSKIRLDFIDHGHLALDLDYARSALDPILICDGPIVNEVIDLKLNTKYFDLSVTVFKDAPLSVCRVSSDVLQNAFTGKTFSTHLNEVRLRQFCELRSKPFHLTGLPHPFN